MLGLLLASGLLAGLLYPPRAAGASRETSRPEEPRWERTSVPLNESCREQIVRQVRASILQLLGLDRPPRFTAEATSHVHEAWAKAVAALPSLSSGGQHFVEVSSNQTLLIRRGGCTQVSHLVTMEDLGWNPWVLQPKAVVFTACLGCPSQRKEEGPPLWSQGCALGGPGHQLESETKQARRCRCRPRSDPLRFAFLEEDGSLVVRAGRWVRSCFGQP